MYAVEDAVGPGNDANLGVNVVPAGANPQTWAIAQEIQDKLVSDPTLAPMGSSLITEVNNDGVVTLRGTVASTDEQQRVTDSISTLPGVKSVNNQLTIGRTSTSGQMNTMYPLE
jgi:osmotically-inducible protein OsmY